jgi:hypothetical protein
MNRDLDYENNNIGYDDCQNKEEDREGIKCKNYIVCESLLPKWWFDCKGCLELGLSTSRLRLYKSL